MYGQLGEMLFKSCRTSEVVIVDRKAVKLFPGSTRIALMHVDMSVADGQFTLAKEQLTAILQIIHKQNK